MRRLSCLVGLALGSSSSVALAKPTAPPPKLATIDIPGDPAFVALARDVIDVYFTVDPSWAANDGLFEDALRVPSFAPARVKQLVARLDQDLAALRALPWRSWSVDAQIDVRWIAANAEALRHQLADEQIFTHRAAAWLEPLSNQLIAFTSYLPDARARAHAAVVWTGVPAMVKELRAIATAPTARDVDTARKLIAALRTMAAADGGKPAKAAARALEGYDAMLAKLKPTREFAVIGAEGFAWRLLHDELITETPAELLALAQAELARVDAELATLEKQVPKADPAPSKERRARADALTQESLLAGYDGIELALRQATLDGGWVSIPDGVGPIHARPTPDAMVPLTGDGGSMNPPPPFIASDVGFWNVEHFKADWDAARRLEAVGDVEDWQTNGMGPYAAHEGFPGHHLQLAIARMHADPIRSILPDGVQNEGWGLYAEEELWRHDGFGKTPAARQAVLESYRFRITRVVYDVNIETGVWTLQQGADFQQGTKPGEASINEGVLRAIQWPTQLLWYFTGKRQIEQLKAAYKAKLGKRYTDRAFHDAFLAEGSIPIPLIRCKLLGEPVPPF